MAHARYQEAAQYQMHGLGFIWDHEWEDTRGAGVAGLMIQQDGTVNIIALRADVGVNAESTYCEIVAEEMGMRYEDVFLRQQDDVHLPLMTPDGSCNLTTNGHVMKKIQKRQNRSSSNWLRPQFISSSGTFLPHSQ